MSNETPRYATMCDKSWVGQHVGTKAPDRYACGRMAYHAGYCNFVLYGDPRFAERDSLQRDLAALRAEVERLKGRRFPVHTPEGGAPSSVPWAALAPFEAHAMRNHDQDLETLARRGGLGVDELVAVLEGRRWKRMENSDAVARLVELLANCPTCGVSREALAASTARAERAEAELGRVRGEGDTTK